MDGLNLSMPSVFMRMHNIKSAPGKPPCSHGKPQLVKPSGALEKQWNGVVGDGVQALVHLLGKHMHIM